MLELCLPHIINDFPYLTALVQRARAREADEAPQAPPSRARARWTRAVRYAKSLVIYGKHNSIMLFPTVQFIWLPELSKMVYSLIQNHTTIVV